jgi:hypothetical protein
VSRQAINPYPDVNLVTYPGSSQTLAEAKSRREWPLWKEALNQELASLYDKYVYEEVCKSEVPEGKQLIPGKWVFDYKTDSHDEVIGHKARCVAKGFYQSPGVDFDETY